MNLADKKKHYEKLYDAKYINADHALLKKNLPRSRHARRKPINARAILWELLDKANISPEEIENNRKGSNVKPPLNDENTPPPTNNTITQFVDNFKKKINQNTNKYKKKTGSKKKKNTQK